MNNIKNRDLKKKILTVFSERLTALRVKRNLSRKQLSSLCEIATTSIWRYEVGIYIPGSVILDKLAKVLDVESHYFFGEMNAAITGHVYDQLELKVFFGKRLKFLREKNNITQIRLAEILKLARSAIARYESGDILPRKPVLLGLSQVLNVKNNYYLEDF